MKKAISSAFILLLLMFILGYTIYNSKVQRDNFLLIRSYITEIILLNKDFNLYIKHPLTYDNFDIIQSKIDTYENRFKDISDNKILQNIQNSELKNSMVVLDKNIKKKFELISKVKSYRAILNNSFRIIQKLKKRGVSTELNHLCLIIMTVDKNSNIEIKEELINIDKLKDETRNDKYFIKHAKTILIYQLKFVDINHSLKELEVDKKLEAFYLLYEKYSQDLVKKSQTAIGILFLILLLLIILYVFYSYKLIISNKELSRFRKTVENSDNIVLITDNNNVIKYVNEAFTKTTRYTSKEAIGKKPNILKSGMQSKEFYKTLNATIYSGKQWSGKFINVDKHGALSYEKASIMPVLDDHGKIEEFIAIKLDITNETVIGQQLKESKHNIELINRQLKQKVEEEVQKSRTKDRQLIEQSRMAQMGEMLSMIAHQWRQPLSAISATSASIELKATMHRLDDSVAVQKAQNISSFAQHLSATIEDFRKFFKPNNKKSNTSYDEIIKSVLRIVEISLTHKNIQLLQTLDCHETFSTYPSELKQVVLNLIKNAEDVLLEKKVAYPTIKIETYTKKNRYILEVRDNAGGIPEEIIDHIFDPYFSTKKDKNGTGLGLYMSKMIVEDHCEGKLSVSNDSDGAVFRIIIKNTVKD